MYKDERWASGAAGSRSEERAKAVSRRLHAVVSVYNTLWCCSLAKKLGAWGVLWQSRPCRSTQMWCMILGVGNGSTAQSLANVSPRIVRGPPRRLNQYRHARSTLR